jgi:RNA polymerase sigma-70 factor (ECF subfamily)
VRIIMPDWRARVVASGSQMDRLADVFWAVRGEGEAAVNRRGIDVLLLALYTRGRAAHPDIDLEDTAFAEHLGRCGALVEPGGDGSRVQAEDLYQCCAALGGNALAIAQLRRENRPVLAGYLRHIDASPAFVDEIEQRLWDTMLVGTIETPPKLVAYAGRGPLAGWLGVTAQRLALMQRRGEAAEERAADRLAVEVDLVEVDPELAFAKHHLRDQFRSALNRGLEALSDRERMIYRLHVVDGLSLDRIAKMYGVAQSTVSRRMAGARDSIVAEAKRVLREEMHIAPEEYEWMARLLISQLDLSVSRLFGKTP